MCIIISSIFSTGKKIAIIVLLILINIFYSSGVLYNLNHYFKPVVMYGSMDKDIKNNNFGSKTFSYLIKEKIIKSSKIIISGKKGLQKEKYGILSNDDSLSYYLTAESENDIKHLEDSGDFLKFEYYLVAIANNKSTELKKELENFCQKNKLNLITEIYDTNREKIIMNIYANYQVDEVIKYNSKEIDKAYNKKYQNLQEMSKNYLGMF